jgi:hypothetical protein
LTWVKLLLLMIYFSIPFPVFKIPSLISPASAQPTVGSMVPRLPLLKCVRLDGKVLWRTSYFWDLFLRVIMLQFSHSTVINPGNSSRTSRSTYQTPRKRRSPLLSLLDLFSACSALGRHCSRSEDASGRVHVGGKWASKVRPSDCESG